MNVWAAIILWENADANVDCFVKTNEHEKLTIAYVRSIDDAVRIAVSLVDDGAELIELCGGFGLDAGAIVSRAIDGRAAIGTVMFGIESITQAAAYKAKFASQE